MSSAENDMMEETTLAVLKSMPFGVYYCDRNLIVRYINRPYARYIGVEPKDIIGRKITDFIPTSRAKAVIESGREELYQETSLLSERANQRIMVNRLPLRSLHGEVIGFVSQLMSVGDEGWENIWHKMECAESFLRRMQPAQSQTESYAPTSGIVGASPQIRRCVEKALLYGATGETVLITGPTGVGKELFARTIQQNSHRSGKAFVCVNCASISKEFICSELFGYAPGAFTGASRQGKVGLMETADGGTLFLDEIGDLPLEAQGVLLRVLETRQVQRMNALQTKDVDFRLICATNRDLWAMCQKRLFREDLFFRLNTLMLEIPPLAERQCDIPLLVRHFLGKMHKPGLDMDDAAMVQLQKYAWPGNVRELRNAVIYAAVNAGYGMIGIRHLPARIVEAVKAVNPAKQTSAAPETMPTRPLRLSGDAEKNAIWETMHGSGGNLTRAARQLSISRTTLYAKLKKYGLPRRPL